MGFLMFCRNNRRKKSYAFTLVELLVVVVIIGILAAIALPNFIGAQLKARVAAVKGNMRTIQIASEAYSTDSGGTYDNGTTYQNYLPGGSNSKTGAAGFMPKNPITGADTVVGDAGLTTTAQIATARATPATGSAPVSAGNVGYSVADGGTTYAVIGADGNGNFVNGNGGFVLVLSN